MSLLSISNIPKQEMLHIARQFVKIPRTISSKPREIILDYIDKQENQQIQSALLSASQRKEELNLFNKRPLPPLEAENKADATTRGLPRRRIDKFDAVLNREQYDKDKYLDLPGWDDVKQNYRDFYKATSNAAVCLTICAVCAREVGQIEDEVTVLALDELPNAQRLCPILKHTAHDLFDGKLLEPKGVSTEECGKYRVNVCMSCHKSLSKETPNTPPPLSLANNKWIGRIPVEISDLTFPEQLLIAHLYPRVYVFKLFPKNAGGIDPSKLQRAMGGTVTTFELDMSGIVSMLEGNLMPRSPALLASLISVTFIGLGRLPKSWLCQFFRVRRRKVHAALCWFKENNPKYYGGIEIDQGRLAQLPEDDVPEELLTIIRQSTETGIIDHESAGYVPINDEDHNDLDSQVNLQRSPDGLDCSTSTSKNITGDIGPKGM